MFVIEFDDPEPLGVVRDSPLFDSREGARAYLKVEGFYPGDEEGEEKEWWVSDEQRNLFSPTCHIVPFIPMPHWHILEQTANERYYGFPRYVP